VICDNALVNGFALGRRPIGVDIIDEVSRDFDIGPAGEPGLPAEWQRQAAAAQRAVPHNNVEVFSRPGAATPPPSAVPDLDEVGPAGAPAVGEPGRDGHGREMFTTVTRKRRFSFF
jgi:hypothetical protein